MSLIHVHYFVDGRFGTVDIHISGTRRYDAKVPDSNQFAMTVNNLKKVPIGKRTYNTKTKVWTMDSGYWNQVLPFYVAGAGHLYELVSYKFESDWLAFIAGEVELKNGKPKIDPNAPDHVKAQGFFRNFNQVIEATASSKTDKEVLASLIGVSSLSELDGANTKALKTIYRATAIRLHPDKNNGDGEKMALFTQLWGIYVQPRA